MGNDNHHVLVATAAAVRLKQMLGVWPTDLGKAAAGTATILETYTTTGASGEVLQRSTPFSAASKACNTSTLQSAELCLGRHTVQLFSKVLHAKVRCLYAQFMNKLHGNDMIYANDRTHAGHMKIFRMLPYTAHGTSLCDSQESK